ncbi:MAG TPA: electron transfer flavoprotein subunit beta/FixA family protein [Spirochaetota bacterium]|nr:electron transfer flavoprotein subunit beta/FixA family protein [Spirochaetota bacterium]HQO40178.1 electron transfer flavoprotein subunit beta/FixA family protein [Spirochaetota bacterium]
MRILVCIKQIADAESRPIITGNGSWAEYGNKTAYRLNRFDEHAIEEALLLKNADPGTEVDILSIGPERVKTAVRRGIEMGADRGVHINLEEKGYTSPLLKAGLIATYCKSAKYDLIITGVMSEDMMSGQTGPMIAALLGYPSAAGIIGLALNRSKYSISVRRELDGASACSMTIKLPALVTVQSGINRPRYPSLSNVMRAKTAVIEEIDQREKTTPALCENVHSVIETKQQRAGLVLCGTTTEKAEALWQMLHKKSLI